MNEQNYTYLKDGLKYMGFGEGVNAALLEKMKEGSKEFMLGHSASFGDRQIDATLFFRKSDSTDMYFFNKWVGTVGQFDGARSQSFYINKGQGITLKEGFNLLEGRAVHKELTDKEGQSYKAWLQLDGKEKDAAGNFKVHQYHEKYGFELEKKLGELPIKQLADPEQRSVLVKSLQKGNLHTVTMEKNGQSDQLFIAANPRYKSIAAYDLNGKGIPQHALEKWYELGQKESEVKMIGRAVTPEKFKQQQKSAGRDGDLKTTSTKEVKQRAGGLKQNAGALPKNRTGKRNGPQL